MSRAAIYTIIKTDATLSTTYQLDDVYSFQGVDTPTPDKPFIVARWGTTEPGATFGRGPARLELWVYDRPADYTRIDAIIARIKTLLTNAVHVAGTDGYTLTQATWMGESEDLYDDVYERIVKTTSFTVVSRPTS